LLENINIKKKMYSDFLLEKLVLDKVVSKLEGTI